MNNSSEIINFINGYQFKSISYIEKFNKLSAQKEFDFDYSIALQTNTKLSSVIDIFVTKDELIQYFIEPLKTLLGKANQKNVEPIEVEIKSCIPSALFSYSSLNKLLPDGYLRDHAKSYGCTEYFKIKYSLEDKFVNIKASVFCRSFILKRKPKIIQPKTLNLSLDEIDELILMLETTLL
jgi:hypothetical protein